MDGPKAITWISFNPAFSRKSKTQAVLLNVIKNLKKFSRKEITTDRQSELEQRRIALLESYSINNPDYRKYIAAINLLIDLLKQGWQLKSYKRNIKIGRPDNLYTENDSRNYIRMQLHAERNEQLKEESVQSFIKAMEAKRYYKNNMISIFNLMRDGRELSQNLLSSCLIKDENERVNELNKITKPYIQYVTENDRCELTGLKLIDIWRYFRHTWANPYKSIPGRTMMLLVRDEATQYHAVIGIAALSSATVGNTIRDNYLGWTSEKVYNTLLTL